MAVGMRRGSVSRRWRSALVWWCAAAAFSAGCGDCAGGGAVENDPEVEITAPMEGALMDSRQVTVVGTARDTRTVTVNGQTADVVAGKWQIQIAAEEGDNVVVAEAGEARDEATFTVDTMVPVVTLEQPPRGLVVPAGQGEAVVVVEGSVEEQGTGLHFVKVGEQIVELDAQGRFRHEQVLSEGLNRVSVTAVDRAGNEGDALRGVLHGEMVDPTSPVDPGMRLVITQDALAVGAEVLEGLLTPQRVAGFVEMALMLDNVTVKNVSFAPVDVSTSLVPGAVVLSADVSQVEVEVDATFGEDTYTIVLMVAAVGVDTRVHPDVDAQGQLTFMFDEAELRLDDSAISFEVRVGDEASLSSQDAEFLRDLMGKVARLAFAQLLSDRLIDQLYDPDVLKRRVELLGAVMEFELVLESLQVSSDAILLEANLALGGEAAAGLPELPGALGTPLGPSGAVSAENDVLFLTNRTALNRLLHAVWRSGLLSQQLVGADFAGLELPVALSSDELALLLGPELRDAAPPNTPAALQLRPLLPPVLRFDPQAGGTGVVLQLAELLVDMALVPPDGGEVQVVTVALFLDLAVDIGVEGVLFNLGFDAEAAADLDAEPLADLHDAQVEALFEELFALVPTVMSEGLELGGAADITWITLENTQIEILGPQRDHLVIGVSAKANPEGLQQP